MRSFNKVLLIGNLTRDPIVKDVGEGVKVATFTLATNKGVSGEKKEKQADFHKVVAWRGLAEVCGNYLKKGSAVLVEGKIANNKYENKEGKKVQSTEIHADEVNFITFKKDEAKDEVNLEVVEVK